MERKPARFGCSDLVALGADIYTEAIQRNDPL
jgi:hypothetical protein